MPEVNSTETLESLELDLPHLASQAAIELDMLLRNQKVGLRATKELASWLGKAFEGLQGGAGHEFLLDPPTEMLVARAFQRSQRAVTLKTVDDLFKEASKFASTLRAVGSDSERKTLESSRAFCAALAESAALYRHAKYFEAPMNPFRH